MLLPVRLELTRWPQFADATQTASVLYMYIRINCVRIVPQHNLYQQPFIAASKQCAYQPEQLLPSTPPPLPPTPPTTPNPIRDGLSPVPPYNTIISNSASGMFGIDNERTVKVYSVFASSSDCGKLRGSTCSLLRTNCPLMKSASEEVRLHIVIGC